MIHTTLRATSSSMWQLDSEFSRHMIGDRSLFSNYVERHEGSVTFDDGSSIKIVGKGTIDAPRIPKLRYVLYVEDLKQNLLSISQICDGYAFNFSKDYCEIKDRKSEKVLMRGIQTSDNCYIIESINLNACFISHTCETDLWHQRLHVNYRDLSRMSRKELIKGLPKMEKFENPIYSGCQLDKQTRQVHKKVIQIGAIRH